MQMEKDGEAYCRECAAWAASPGLRRILLLLAEAELLHYDLFGRLGEGEEARLPPSALIEQVMNVFAELRAREGAAGARSSEADLYRKAQELERRSWELYEREAGRAASPAERAALERIALEEHRHFRILEGIVDFVSRPEQWLEDAEWYRLEEY